MFSLLIGIISSLVATALFIGAAVLIQRVLIPWYADLVYKGVRLDGIWHCKELDESTLDGENWIQFSLKQRGDSITGSCRLQVAKEELPTEYELSGVLRDMHFLATAVPANKKHIDGASFLLHVHHYDKLTMRGGALVEGNPGEVDVFKNIKFVLVEA